MNECHGICLGDFTPPCPYCQGTEGVILEFTLEELEALSDFFPRVQVANVVREHSSLHTALLKLSPKSLPTRLQDFNDRYSRGG